MRAEILKEREGRKCKEKKEEAKAWMREMAETKREVTLRLKGDLGLERRLTLARREDLGFRGD